MRAVKSGEKVVLGVRHKYLHQDKNKMNPELQTETDTAFQIEKITSTDVLELNEGDIIRIVASASSQWFYMPGKELESWQGKMSDFKLFKAEEDGEQVIRIRSGVCLQNSETGIWVGLTSTGQQLTGYDSRDKAVEIQIREYYLPVVAPSPKPATYCLKVITGHGTVQETYTGLYSDAYQRLQQMKAGETNVVSDKIDPGPC